MINMNEAKVIDIALTEILPSTLTLAASEATAPKLNSQTLDRGE
jgi:hypothetical protein